MLNMAVPITVGWPTRGRLINALLSLILALALLSASGCGFRLRGQAELPPEMAVTYIQTNRSPISPPSELGFVLQRALEANGVTVTDDPAEATAKLIIVSEQFRRRTLAAGPRGEAREYTLNYSVDYTVTNADGTPLIPRETAALARDLLYDESDVLGREAGEEIILRALREDVTRSILLRLQIAARP